MWGIRQVYGFAYSNHSLYALTGSFYNPGPYSGYLAMIFPVCLYEWLKRKEHKKTISYYIALFGMLLILCVLPAGMSRSAWIAAAVSSIYVCGMHYRVGMSVTQGMCVQRNLVQDMVKLGARYCGVCNKILRSLYIIHTCRLISVYVCPDACVCVNRCLRRCRLTHTNVMACMLLMFVVE